MNTSIDTHTVDLTADPPLPNNYWKIEEHRGEGVVRIERRGEDLYIDEKKVDLFLADQQKEGMISSAELRKVLKDKSVLNANVLDCLLEHQELIPESWKGKYPFFWGTIYRNPYGYLRVRYLYRYGPRWSWHWRWLENDWDSAHPAAVLAN